MKTKNSSRTVHTCESHAEALSRAADILLQDAHAAGLQKFLDLGSEKGPPISFLLPKNKMTEEDESLSPEKRLKFRVVFSHYSHPLKQYSKKIGRCLSL